MDEYEFLWLGDGVSEELGLAGLPFPVRTKMKEEVFDRRRMAVDLLIDELDLFLDEHPEYAEAYSENMGILCWWFGVDMGGKGYTDIALHYLELGLQYNPDSLSLHANQAVTLQSLGRNRDALEHYEYILSIPAMSYDPIISMLAARCYYDMGDFAAAYKLLKRLALTLPEDEGFWDFLTEARIKAEERLERVPQAQGEIECPRCGQRLRHTARFCQHCGKQVKVIAGEGDNEARKVRQPRFCSNCGLRLRPGARFCRNCGRALRKTGEE